MTQKNIENNTLSEHKMTSREKTVRLAKMGMLVAISIVLVYFIHFPIFPAVAFLEYDPADISILIGTFAFGPLAGILLTVVTSVIQGDVYKRQRIDDVRTITNSSTGRLGYAIGKAFTEMYGDRLEKIYYLHGLRAAFEMCIRDRYDG